MVSSARNLWVCYLVHCEISVMGSPYAGSIYETYHRNSGAQVKSPGLSLLPKLKYEHIYLTSFSKMRVDLAAQVKESIPYYIHTCSNYFNI